LTVARPPQDPAELSAFPVKTVAPGFPYTRIHKHWLDAGYFCHDHACRFDPPAGSNAFGTCYLSGHPLGAFVEKFGDLEVVRRSLVDLHRLSSLMVPPARLADMTDRAVLGRWHLSAEIGAGDDYDGCQAWAERLFEAGFGGIWYQARHDPAAGLHSIALFGKPGLDTAGVLVPAGSTEIPDAVIDAAAEQFRIEVVPDSAIGP
jgi:hypothetical protein